MAFGGGGGLEGIGACGTVGAIAGRPCVRPAVGGLAWALDIGAAPEEPELEAVAWLCLRWLGGDLALGPDAPGPGLKTTQDCGFGRKTSLG